MAAPEVNSRPQDAKIDALEPPSRQELKPEDSASLTRRQEEKGFSIRTGPENMKKTPATMANSKLLRPLPKSIIGPKKRKLAH